MTTQRKATSSGDNDSVTHENVPEPAGPDASDAVSRAGAGSRVTLALMLGSIVRFDLSAQNLPDVTTEGTSYTTDEADVVKTLALKYGVPLYEVKKES